MNMAEVWTWLGPWLQLLSFVGAVLQCLGVVALYLLTQRFVTRKDCKTCRDALEARLKLQEDSAGELKNKVADTPTKDDVAAVDKADEALRGDIKALVATIQGLKEQQGALSHQVSLLMRHHLGGNR